MNSERLIITALAVCLTAFEAESQSQNEVFARLVGPEVAFDPEIVARVLEAGPGVRITVDTDGDGAVDEVYFIDNDERHGDLRQPLLVKIVDEDGDMGPEGDGDLDSDLYIADWYGDGTIDRIVDYVDLDGDGDVDEQYLYQWSELPHIVRRVPKKFDDKVYAVAWAKDYGDDNRLWHHTNYEYGQLITQWQTDFNGDEMFVYLLWFDYDLMKLTPVFENAFSFYDLDGDECSEEVVRFTGNGAMSDDLRYSMDIDNDSGGENRHDFDFSISGVGPIVFRPENCRTVTVRGIEAGPIMRWEDMRQIAIAGPWTKLHLTWDENDNNVDPRPGQMHFERWEGVLNHGNDYMPQIGGPSCGPYNKRNEIDMDASGGMLLYFSPADRRIHLYGAEIGWIEADYDYDGTVDLIVRMKDLDGNGFFDVWEYDVDADGVVDRSVAVSNDRCELLPFRYDALHRAYNPLLAQSLEADSVIVNVMKTLLTKTDDPFIPDDIETYYRTCLPGFDTEFGMGAKMAASPEAGRYYFDLIRERYWQRIIQSDYASKSSFTLISAAYDAGDWEHAAALLSELED